MMVMVSRWQRFGALGLAFAAGVLITVVVVAVSRFGPASSSNAEATPSVPAPVSPSPSGELLRIGGVPAAAPVRTLDPTLAPYPFMSPTPPPTETELDGTYLRTLTLRDVGGARIGLPFRCLRCPPYRIDAGVSTIIFTRGAFYLHHQMSGFKTHGSFVIEGDRLILFNDANCPQERGVYAFEIEPHGVRFDVIHDDCPWSGERADDLMAVQWTHVHACVRWIQNLWPGAVAC
jgi:hypothetical protein